MGWHEREHGKVELEFVRRAQQVEALICLHIG
jgi:hypothetical protein